MLAIVSLVGVAPLGRSVWSDFLTNKRLFDLARLPAPPMFALLITTGA